MKAYVTPIHAFYAPSQLRGCKVSLHNVQFVECVASVADIVGTASARKRNAGFWDIVAAGGDTDGDYDPSPTYSTLSDSSQPDTRSAS
ncbi:TPA: hypothetical protein ACH3X2_005297 [Trebouxia sp. C0005]